MMCANDINDKNNRSPLLEAVLFGGAGDFGMNMMVLKSRNCSLMLDAGSALPGLIHFGITDSEHCCIELVILSLRSSMLVI